MHRVWQILAGLSLAFSRVSAAQAPCRASRVELVRLAGRIYQRRAQRNWIA